jgi:uncharacterized protein (UPF0297 family)
METIKVIIENWQPNSWIETWMPIIIAVIALVTSVVSLFLTKVQFRKSSRPFLCAMSYANLQNEQLNPIPSLVGYRITNNPAKIYSSRVIIQLNEDILVNHHEENFVRFNASNSEWSFGVGRNEFDEIIRNHGLNPDLRRIIKLKYSALDGGKKYHFLLVQNFVQADNQWKDLEVKAD